MCEKTSVLVLFLIIKFIIIFLIPAILIIFRNKIEKKFLNIIFCISLLFLILFIFLRLFNNSCIIYSNINGIKINNYKNFNSITVINNNYNNIESFITDKIYKSASNKNVYYFNHNDSPLADKVILCDNKNIYLKQYGNNITAVSMLLSYVEQKNIDPIEILNIAIKNDLLDCDTGVDTDKLLQILANNYNLKISYLNKNSLLDYIRSGGVAIAKVINNPSHKNISCGESNIMIYNLNKENKYNILDPNSKDYDYICPNNSAGYGQIISANSNDVIFSTDELDSISYEYITLERN